MGEIGNQEPAVILKGLENIPGCKTGYLVCRRCRSKTFEMVRLSEEGKIVTFTIIKVGPDKFSKETPYVVAIIE